MSAVAASPFGIAAFVFLALGVLGLFGLVGKGARRSVGVAGIGSFAVLFAIAMILRTAVPEDLILATDGQPAPPVAQDQPPASRDFRRAVELLAEAEQHNNLGRTEAARAAFADAEERFRAANNIDGVGAVAMGLGILEASLGQPDEAREAFARARDLFRQSGNLESEALVLTALGDLEKTTLRFEAARVAYAEAREIFGGAAGADGRGHVLLGIEDLAAMPEGEDEARRALAEAQLLYQQIDDKKGLGLVALVRAELERNLGNNPQAYTKYREAIVLINLGGHSAMLADTWYRLGTLELDRGFHNTADEALGQAAALYQSLGADDGAALAHLGLAHLQRILGDYAQSTLFYVAALDAFEELGDTDGQAIAMFGIAESARLGERWTQAQERYSQAADIFFRGANPGKAAQVWLGRAKLESGDRVAESLSQAVALSEDSTDGRVRGLVFLAWGSYQTSSGDPSVAGEFLGAAAKAFHGAGMTLGHAAALAEMASLERARGNFPAAEKAFSEAQALMAAMSDPLAAANRVLGFGNFGQLRVHLADEGEDIDYELDGEGGLDAAEPATPNAPPEGRAIDPHAEALIPYPNANAEALAFLAGVVELLETR